MAFPQTASPPTIFTENSPQQRSPQPPSKHRFLSDLSQCLFDFVIQLLPTAEEMAVKEDVRKLLERLIRTIEPDSRLLSFGSTANGFSLRNSDMDLCCLIDSEERLNASDLVTMLGDLLERETKFHVKPLPHARIPIVKLSLDPSPGLPLGIACDIGFENRLALENTRLLMCYALIDPTRVRTLVLFLKVWSKRRKINSPYKGTLSSYGYVLLVIYFLVHVKNPPVLPNLQQMPPLRPIPSEETHINSYNVWFFDDIDLLRQRWHSENTETVAELLIDFFRYFSREFLYNTGVASIRAGLLKKEAKGWQGDASSSRYNDSRDRNRLCIEDPFETDFNVGRCVTKDGLYTIRGEFMRAMRILASRPDRAIFALAELCEERKAEELIAAPANSGPRLSNIPPQTPYSVGSQSRSRPAEGLSPPTKFYEPDPRPATQAVTIRPPPEHMAPRRGKWTSPPPPEAPPADHALFETQLGMVLELATAPTAARQAHHSSSSNSEVISDEDRSDVVSESDDVKSVHSFTEGSSSPSRKPPPLLFHQGTWRLAPLPINLTAIPPSSCNTPSPRGRQVKESPPSSSSPKPESVKRSISGPPRSVNVMSTKTPVASAVPLPPSPESPLKGKSTDSQATVYYSTPVPSPLPMYHYQQHSPHTQSPSTAMPLLPQYQLSIPSPYYVPHDIYPSNLPPLMQHRRDSLSPFRTDSAASSPKESTSGSNSPLRLAPLHFGQHNVPNSSPVTLSPVKIPLPSSIPHTPHSPRSREKSPERLPASPLTKHKGRKGNSSRRQTNSSGSGVHTPTTTIAFGSIPQSSSPPRSTNGSGRGSSPALSATGSGYAASGSRSPSPPLSLANAIEEALDESNSIEAPPAVAIIPPTPSAIPKE